MRKTLYSIRKLLKNCKDPSEKIDRIDQLLDVATLELNLNGRQLKCLAAQIPDEVSISKESRWNINFVDVPIMTNSFNFHCILISVNPRKHTFFPRIERLVYRNFLLQKRLRALGNTRKQYNELLGRKKPFAMRLP